MNRGKENQEAKKIKIKNQLSPAEIESATFRLNMQLQPDVINQLHHRECLLGFGTTKLTYVVLSI